MVIDISQVLKGEGQSKDINTKLELENFSFFGNDVIFAEPLTVNGVIKNLGNVIFLEGNAKSVIKAECGRCLKSFDYSLDFDFEQKFSKNPVSDDVMLFEGYEIDIDDVIIQNICLSLPMSFLCSDDCKGLCATCGKNLNEGDCDCENENIDPRMEVLKNFLK